MSDAQATALDIRLEIHFDLAGTTGVLVDPGDNPPDGGNTFRYDPDNDLFIFNLGTKNSTWEADFSYRATILVSETLTREAYFGLR